MRFSDLDFEGRCGTAFARIGPDTVSNEKRGDISQVHPSGWVQRKYSFVDDGMLYNRSHLIAHQLCGENANEKNLITGTRTFNAVGMLYYEELVGDYVRSTATTYSTASPRCSPQTTWWRAGFRWKRSPSRTTAKPCSSTCSCTTWSQAWPSTT